VVGERVTKLYGLVPLNQDYFYKYDQNLYPHIMNEFSTAAFRFGHTLVRGSFTKADADYRAFDRAAIKDLVFQPIHAFKKGGLDAFARGCLIDKAQHFDPYMNNFLSNHLFEGLNEEIETKRFSLPALNVNRGRDHGLPGYNHYRALCGLNYANSFAELYNVPEEVREKLARVYDHVNDIDLFTGGTSEHPIEGGVVGPTFACEFFFFLF
jgi:peroxidase